MKKINLEEIPQEQLEKERNPNYEYFSIEETKQETTEEVSIKISEQFDNQRFKSGVYFGVKEGAKWQAQKMYSEQDMQEYATFCIRCHEQGLPCIIAQDWFKLYKN
jgi:cytochrome c553